MLGRRTHEVVCSLELAPGAGLVGEGLPRVGALEHVAGRDRGDEGHHVERGERPRQGLARRHLLPHSRHLLRAARSAQLIESGCDCHVVIGRNPCFDACLCSDPRRKIWCLRWSERRRVIGGHNAQEHTTPDPQEQLANRHRPVELLLTCLSETPC
jgi:hypothetical protein